MEARHQGAAAARARYHIPVNHFRPPDAAEVAQVFEAERHAVLAPGASTASRALPLDRSAALGLPFAATTPTMLARYLQLREGEPLALQSAALACIAYVISGQGFTTAGDERIDWGPGDVMVLPAGDGIRHEANAQALLFTVSDEPLWQALGVRALREAAPAALHYPAAGIAAEMARLDALAAREEAVGRAVIFTGERLQAGHLTTPFFIANINTLEAGRDQRTHHHNGAAITLSIQGEGCSSVVAGRRVDWAPWGAMVTPAGQPHSHHNRGSRTMVSLVVQDSGFYQHAGVSGFGFDADDDAAALRLIDGANAGIGRAAIAPSPRCA